MTFVPKFHFTKLSAATGPSTLAVAVSKQGTLATALEVVSSGPDDSTILDDQLTPGPETRPIDLVLNTYVLGWTGAFVTNGSATLNVEVDDPDGGLKISRSISVDGLAGDVFTRVVFLP